MTGVDGVDHVVDLEMGSGVDNTQLTTRALRYCEIQILAAGSCFTMIVEDNCSNLIQLLGALKNVQTETTSLICRMRKHYLIGNKYILTIINKLTFLSTQSKIDAESLLSVIELLRFFLSRIQIMANNFGRHMDVDQCKRRLAVVYILLSPISPLAEATTYFLNYICVVNSTNSIILHYISNVVQ